MKSIFTYICLLCFAMYSFDVKAQSESEFTTKSNIGVELQVYLTGTIPGLRYELPLSANSHLHLRAGYQIIDHRDLGKNDDETGTGYGFSLGYKYHLGGSLEGFSLMVKNDFWWNTIDWMGTEEDPTASGVTDILVLQPTVQAEYHFMLSPNLALIPSLAFGLEWNVKTEGQPTGEGPILLVGIALSKAF